MSHKLTHADVAAHTGRHDLYVIIHDKVLDLSNFVDEHPGGEEVLVDQGGKDATEAFEDVGHSEDARRILDKLVIGILDKTRYNNAKPATSTVAPVSQPRGLGSSVGVIVVLFSILAALGAYRVTAT
ncbi:hypothetical protein LTS15_003830 [Exophiala xenobiotica]|nr:hypothetical protein LTS15_003830 [Exophiala xenobiotica]